MRWQIYINKEINKQQQQWKCRAYYCHCHFHNYARSLGLDGGRALHRGAPVRPGCARRQCAHDSGLGSMRVKTKYINKVLPPGRQTVSFSKICRRQINSDDNDWCANQWPQWDTSCLLILISPPPTPQIRHHTHARKSSKKKADNLSATRWKSRLVMYMFVLFNAIHGIELDPCQSLMGILKKNSNIWLKMMKSAALARQAAPRNKRSTITPFIKLNGL